jgi:putative SOS response-associated peptidase YedK
VTKRKAKVWFELEDGSPFAFAGIWRPGDQGLFMSFLTCEPNETVGAVHPNAMPVMLAASDYERWLADDHASACELATPYPDEQMRMVE